MSIPYARARLQIGYYSHIGATAKSNLPDYKLIPSTKTAFHIGDSNNLRVEVNRTTDAEISLFGKSAVLVEQILNQIQPEKIAPTTSSGSFAASIDPNGVGGDEDEIASGS